MNIRTLRTFVISTLLIGGQAMAHASTSAEAINPLHNLQKVGEAKLEFLFWDIYHSTLYSPDGSFAEDNYPLALHIEYLRDIEASDLVDRTADEWRKLGFEEKQFTPWLQSIGAMWPDIEKGDALTLVVSDDGQSAFYLNEAPLGVMTDSEFGPSFLAIWLDENCSYPKLRKKLIGLR